MQHLRIIRLLLAGLIILSLNTTFASCGSITIADTQTPSSSLLTHIDKFIITHAFGCRVTVTKGNPLSIINQMIQTGKPDIAPEVWVDGFQSLINKAQAEYQLFAINNDVIIGGGKQSLWLPSYLAKDNESLKTLAGIKKYATSLRSTGQPKLPILYNCQPNKDCSAVVNHLYKTLQLKHDEFNLLNLSTLETLNSTIEQAYNQKQPWIGFYPSPSTVTAKFPMIKVNISPQFLSEKAIDDCITSTQCSSSTTKLYLTSKIQTLISRTFALRALPAHNYIQKRQLTSQQLNTMLLWMDKNQAPADAAAYYFFIHHEKVWRRWLSVYGIGKVRRALNPL